MMTLHMNKHTTRRRFERVGNNPSSVAKASGSRLSACADRLEACPTALGNPSLTVKALFWLGLCALSLLMSGCQRTQYDDPMSVMTDPDRNTNERIRAIKQTGNEQPGHPERIAFLKEVCSESGHTQKMRTVAFDELLTYDEQDTRDTFRLRVPYLPSWSFLEHVCDRAVEYGWTDYTPSLIRSLSKTSPFYIGETRPEETALLELHPEKDLTTIIYNYVAQPSTGPLDERWRMHAWELLAHRAGVRSVMTQLIEANADQPNDPFMANIQTGYNELGIVPLTREEVLWLQRVLKPENSAWYDRCKAAVDTLSPEQRAELSMRHLAVLVRVHDHHPDWLTMSRPDLVQDLTFKLNGRKMYTVTKSAVPVLTNSKTQKFDHWKDKLAWADLITIRLALTIVDDPDIQHTLFAQTERDRTDITTEHGGIFDLDEQGQPVAVPFSPRIRQGDYKFFAPDEMVERGYTAPFHYHFHVQEEDTRDHAAPGLGDLQYAQTMGINGLVITSVSHGRLNVDYYQPIPAHAEIDQDEPFRSSYRVTIGKDQAVVDLGSFRIN